MTKRTYQDWVEEFKNPSAQIPYKTYIKILKNEFNITEGKRSHSAGSKRSFIISKKSVFVIHEPHKKGKDQFVGKWDHQNILFLLKKEGLIK